MEKRRKAIGDQAMTVCSHTSKIRGRLSGKGHIHCMCTALVMYMMV